LDLHTCVCHCHFINFSQTFTLQLKNIWYSGKAYLSPVYTEIQAPYLWARLGMLATIVEKHKGSSNNTHKCKTSGNVYACDKHISLFCWGMRLSPYKSFIVSLMLFWNGLDLHTCIFHCYLINFSQTFTL
jgi:hypothetical protein